MRTDLNTIDETQSSLLSKLQSKNNHYRTKSILTHNKHYKTIDEISENLKNNKTERVIKKVSEKLEASKSRRKYNFNQ